MTEQLKPCPFCGGAAHFFKITDLDDKNFGGEGICCGSCPITTDLMFSLMEDCKPKLAEAWNRRAQPAQAVPPGYVLVPVEPTPEIVAVMAVQEASGSINGTKTIGMAGAVAAYDAMLATAQGEKP